MLLLRTQVQTIHVLIWETVGVFQIRENWQLLHTIGVEDPDGLDISRCYFSCTKSAFDNNKYCGYNRFMPSMTMWDGNTITVEGKEDGYVHPTTQPIDFVA